MEREDELKSLLAHCTWVRDADTALRVAPALGSDLPALTMIAGQDARACIPIACAAPITQAVFAVLKNVLPGALRGEREPIHKADRGALRADPLVPLLASLTIESCSVPALENHVVPALAVAWATSTVLSGGSTDGELQALTRQLSLQPPADRAKTLKLVAWSLSGRLGACHATLRRLGYAPRAGGLSRLLLNTPLALCLPAGSLRDESDYALVAQLIGVDVPAAVLVHLRTAVATALKASAARVPQRPVDVERASLVRQATGDPLFQLGTGPRLVALLPELVEARDLAAQGVPADIAGGFVQPDSAVALASAWDDILSMMLRWDALSAVVAAVQPLRSIRGRWRVDAGALSADLPWALLSPRGEPGSPHTVVAVRLSTLRAAARQGTDGGLAQGLADRAFMADAAESGCPHVAIVADHGVAVFRSPPAALAFARAIRAALQARRSLPMHGFGDDVLLPAEKDLSIGIATGTVLGGTDGRHLSFGGPPVADAIALAGIGPLSVAPDPLGIRGVSMGPGGLHSSGITSDEATLERLIKAARDASVPLHVAGEGGMAAGISDDFATYPFRAWWEGPDGVVAALSLTHADGAAEILFSEPAEFAALHEQDVPRTDAPLQTSAPDTDSVDPFSFSAAASPTPDTPNDPFQTIDDPESDTGLEEETFAFAFDHDESNGVSDPLGQDGTFSHGNDEADAGDAFGFAMPPDEPPAGEEESGFGFAMPADDEPDEDLAPPQMLDDGDEEESGSGFAMPAGDSPEENFTPPQLLDGDEEESGFGFAMPADDDPEDLAPPELLDDDEEESGFGFAMPADDEPVTTIDADLLSGGIVPPMLDDDDFGDDDHGPMVMLEDDDDDDSDTGVPVEDEARPEDVTEGFDLPGVEDESGFGFAMSDESMPERPQLRLLDDEEESGFGFAMPADDDPEVNVAPPHLVEDEDEEEPGFGFAMPADDDPEEDLVPPQMLDDDDEEEPGFGFAMPADDDSEEGLAPPELLDDDEEESGFGFAMPADDEPVTTIDADLLSGGIAPPMLDDDDFGDDDHGPMVMLEDDDDDDSDIGEYDHESDEVPLEMLLEPQDTEEAALDEVGMSDLDVLSLDAQDGDDFMMDMPTLQQASPLPPPMLLEDEPSGVFEPVGDSDAGSAGVLVEVDDEEEDTGVSEEFLRTDIARIFQRYIVVGPVRGMMTFGLLDEQTIRDAHTYPASSDPHNAYAQFLMDKMREGFVPQVHRTESLDNERADPLDMRYLESAYRQMMGQ